MKLSSLTLSENPEVVLQQIRDNALNHLAQINVPALYEALEKTEKNMRLLSERKITRQQAIVIAVLTKAEMKRITRVESENKTKITTIHALDWLVGNNWMTFNTDDSELEEDLSILENLRGYVFIPYHLHSIDSWNLLKEVVKKVKEDNPLITYQHFIDDIFIGDAFITARTTFTVEELLLPFIESGSGLISETFYDSLDPEFLKRKFL